MKTFIFIKYIHRLTVVSFLNLFMSLITFLYSLAFADTSLFLIVPLIWLVLSILSLISLYYWYRHFRYSDMLFSQLPNIALDFNESYSTRNLQDLYLTAPTQELISLLAPVRSLVNNILSMVYSFKLEQNTLEALLESMSDGVLLVDREGRILRMNSAASKLLDVKNDNLESNQSFMGVVFDHDLANLVNIAFENDQTVQDEIELLHPNKIMDAIVTPVQNSNNKEVVVTLHDLTEIRRINTTRKEFVSNVSHELKTPLTAVKAMIETMESGVLPKNRQKEYFAKINNEIDQMANIVGELLKLSGIERENYRDSFVTVDINILIANVSQTFADIIKKKLINIELNLAPSSLIISCNEYHIREVISNLIDNATKFTSEFGTITLTTKLSDHFVIIRCDDTGIGIAQEDIPHIFERFYKVDKSRSNAGTGLGLSITKHILDNHHASIEVNSSLNNGSAFIITLPLSESNIIS
jgi:two-component system phosphate regulon sensor histidine kinase PhoR